MSEHDQHRRIMPGEILGYRKNGQPIRLIAGGSEPAVEPPATGAPAEPAPSAAPAPAPPAPAAGSEPSQPTGTGQEPPAAAVDDLPSWAQKEFRKLRDENAGNRVKAKEAADAATAAVEAMRAEQEAQRLAMGKALGLVTDEPPSAEELSKQLQTSQAESAAERDRARQAAVELAVFRAAAAMQADGNALLDSRSFTGTLAALDPAAGDFGERVAAAITTALDAHPQYKLTPAVPAGPQPPAPPTVPKSGAEFTGAPSTPRQWTQQDVDAAAPSQLEKAINDGLLISLGFGPRRGSRR
jgi:hypothetical protein